MKLHPRITHQRAEALLVWIAFFNHIYFAFPCQPHFEEDLVQSLRSLYTREIFPRNWLFVCDWVCYTDAMRKNTNDVYKRRDEQIPIQAMKYGLAAFGGFLADYAVLLLLKEWVGLHYLIAVPIAFPRHCWQLPDWYLAGVSKRKTHTRERAFAVSRDLFGRLLITKAACIADRLLDLINEFRASSPAY
jgi:hypothetical protein